MMLTAKERLAAAIRTVVLEWYESSLRCVCKGIPSLYEVKPAKSPSCAHVVSLQRLHPERKVAHVFTTSMP